jgi:PAS domain S-box-containing protein
VDDMPLTHANAAFTELTGYASEEVIGRNCRFLQGPLTDRDEVAMVRGALDERRRFTALLTNYRKDGSPFRNMLMIGPLDGQTGRDTILGCQYEVNLSGTDAEIQAHMRNTRAPLDHVPDQVREAWTAYIDSLTMRMEMVTQMLSAYKMQAHMRTV